MKIAPVLTRKYARARWVTDPDGRRAACAFNDRKAEVMALLDVVEVAMRAGPYAKDTDDVEMGRALARLERVSKEKP